MAYDSPVVYFTLNIATASRASEARLPCQQSSRQGGTDPQDCPCVSGGACTYGNNCRCKSCKCKSCRKSCCSCGPVGCSKCPQGYICKGPPPADAAAASELPQAWCI
ncbi:metallothionein-1-like [Rhineura floridana]|uniref:metallothionein-1-like n=1 Tax=Rhineura floridana TaxID=261503 RepID=UPI002AC848AD|nr:metallothionein-1-like [Rhineura floridana]